MRSTVVAAPPHPRPDDESTEQTFGPGPHRTARAWYAVSRVSVSMLPSLKSRIQALPEMLAVRSAVQ